MASLYSADLRPPPRPPAGSGKAAGFGSEDPGLTTWEGVSPRGGKGGQI